MKKRILLPLLLIPFGLLPLISCGGEEEVINSEILKDVKFKYDTKNNTASVNGLKNPDTYIDVVIPEKIVKNNVEYTVTSVENSAFNSNSLVERIVLPNTITTIGEEAFYKCTSLRNIELGNSLTKLGTYAFAQCKGLVNIDLPKSLTSLPFGAFYQCNNLWSIDLPSGIKTLPDKAFYGATQLTYITASSLTQIGDSTFESCTNLKYVYFSSDEFSDEVVGTNNTPYQNINKTFNVDLTKDEIMNKYNFTFNPANNTCDFAGLKDLSITQINDLPGTINYLGNEFVVDGIYKYALFKSLATEITLPDSVITIGNYSFADSKLQTFNSNKVTQIGQYAFQNCSDLENVTLNDEVATIMTYAFQNCTKLTSIELPLNILSLQKGLFSGCYSLTSVTIKNKVNRIAEEVFAGCSALSTINFTDTKEKWDTITKDNDSAEILNNLTIVCVETEE